MVVSVNRRRFLTATASATAVCASGVSFAQSAPKPLPVPRLIDASSPENSTVDLALQAAVHDFGTGAQSETFGIGQNYLGPVVRVHSGNVVPFRISNGIDEATTLHWHGLHIPGDVDGGPHQEIAPGDVWRPEVPINQPASTNWFHAHTHGRTARQTYKGMAGIMLVEDENSLAADLPKTYGVDDFTLVLQDKSFDAAGRLAYEMSGETLENGFQGESLVVNGALAPVFQGVPKGLVRLRLLNACNARFLKVSLNDNQPFHVIASDGGFLAATETVSEISMSPGERYEILVDMAQLEALDLLVAFSSGDGGGNFLSWLFGGSSRKIALTLHQDASRSGVLAAIPHRLANLDPADARGVRKRRSFALNMAEGGELAALAANWGNVCGGAGMGINGRPMNMNHINFSARLGEAEIWKITSGEQVHPFHIHGCSFRILRQEGSAPPAYSSGWKDMVAVGEGVSEVLVRFDHPATEEFPYMYHCHILEHEDCGMMGQFTTVA